MPLESIDPLYYDKSHLLAPDKRGDKPYALLAEALRRSGRCALAKWAWKAREYVVQVRAHDEGLILQQLRYADEVRSLAGLDIPKAAVSKPELQLALQTASTRPSSRTRKRHACWPPSSRRSRASRSSRPRTRRTARPAAPRSST